MPGLIRNLRARSFAAFCWLAMLLAVAGMASVILERVSFGHEHLAEGHALHHHHVFLGSHGHTGEHEHGHEDEHGREHGQQHGQEAPPERPGQPGTAMVSAAPALFQPIAVWVLVAGPAESSLLEPLLAPRPAARSALQPTPPRGPPLSIALPRL
jgi:hypothetical protein